MMKPWRWFARSFIERPVSEWLSLLRAGGVPAGRINNIEESLTDENIQERGMIVSLEHPELGMIRSIATPVQLRDSPLVYRRYPPRIGEHTREILDELQYSDAAVERLYREGIVA